MIDNWLRRGAMMIVTSVLVVLPGAAKPHSTSIAGRTGGLGPGTAYVTNTLSDSVTPVNMSRRKAGTPIVLGPAARPGQRGKVPYGITAAPNGAVIYVTELSGGLTAIKTATDTLGPTVNVGRLAYQVLVA